MSLAIFGFKELGTLLLSEFNQKLCYDESGCFAVGGFEIRLQRKVEKYVNNYFIPAGLLVIISWVRNATNYYLLYQTYMG